MNSDKVYQKDDDNTLMQATAEFYSGADSKGGEYCNAEENHRKLAGPDDTVLGTTRETGDHERDQINEDIC